MNIERVQTGVRIEKRLRNTEEVARALARLAGVRSGDVGYAGRKDRVAVARQWLWVPDLDPERAKSFAGEGFRVLFGEGVSPWKKIFEAAESVGGVEYYLIEQEGSRFPPMETAQRCLA